MTSESLQAFFLYKTWSGETSARVTFLTREAGLITCVCKGVRKPEKQALLQPFMPLWLMIKKYPAYYFVQAMENAALPYGLQGSALFSGLYVNELLYHLKPDASEPMFDAYLATIRSLALADNQSQIEIILRRFEWNLLQVSGYAFSLTETFNDLPIEEDKHYALMPGKGLYPAAQGITGAVILAISQDKMDTPPVLKAAKYLMRNALEHLLGGVVIHSRKLYNPVRP